MRVNPKILKALEQATARYGKTSIAYECALDHNAPGLFLTGQRLGFSWDTWERVWLVLVEKGGLDPNDIDCLPLSKRGTAAVHATLPPEALDLSLRWMRLPRPLQEKVFAFLAQCDGKTAIPNKAHQQQESHAPANFKRKQKLPVKKTVASPEPSYDAEEIVRGWDSLPKGLKKAVLASIRKKGCQSLSRGQKASTE